MDINQEVISSILEQINEVFFRTDIQGNLLMVSQASAKLLGYDSIDVAIGKPLLQFWHNLAEREDLMKTLQQNGEVRDRRIALVKSDGSLIDVEISCHYYRGLDGTIQGIEGVWRDISEKIKSEQALQESELKYHSIFEATGYPFALLDAGTGRIIDVNEAGCKQYGYTREELIGMAVADISVEPEVTEKAVRSGQTYYATRYHRRKDGSIFPVEGHVTAYNWNGKRVMLASIRDISGRIESQKALKESQIRYKGIVDSQLDIVIRLDTNFRIIFANDAWYRVTNTSIDDPQINIRQALFHPDDYPLMDEHNAEVLRSQGRVYSELRLKTLDGWRWYGFESYLIHDADGNVLEIQTVAHDIHDRRIAAEICELNNRRLRLATEAASEGVWEYDFKANYMYLSPQIYSMLGFEDQEIDVSTMDAVMERIVPDDLPGFKDYFERLIDKQTDRVDIQFRCIAKDGSHVWVHSRGKLFEKADDGTPLILGGMLTNITRQKISRTELEKALKELQKAYSLQKEFLKGVTHEMRTPLITVRGYADVLMEGLLGSVNSEQWDCLRKIKSSCDALLNGVTAMLETSRIKNGKVEISYEIFAPVKLVTRVAREYIGPAQEKGVKIQIHDCGCEKSGVTDSTKLSVILNNLIGNAVKFTEKGSIDIHVDSDDTGFTVGIIDTGRGMDNEDVEQIFNEFHQLESSKKYKESGFGVGLALVAAMVDILCAELTVSTIKGTGSAFTLRVPKLDPDQAA